LQRQTMEGSRATLRDQLIAALRSYAEGEQLLIDTIRTVQDRSGWNAVSQDRLGRAVAAFPRADSLDKSALAEIEKSATFSSRLPKDVQLCLGLIHHDDWFQLQVFSFSRNPLYFVVVPENGLAHKMGFQSGDTLVSIAGQTPESALALKSLIRANIGREVKAVVQRDGKELSLKINVPQTLAAN
jgi:hypothetical protein